jgi:transposase
MSKKTRKRFTPQEKLAILRLHLLEHSPVSDLCDRHGIHPTMFYRWQKEFFDNGAAALERRSKRTADLKEQRIAFLEEKLKRKNEVLAEIMEEHVQLKKELGEL